MNKYKVEFYQTETFVVDVYAESEQEATDKASEEYSKGNYQETGHLDVNVNYVYDVTDTDDPFNP